jgi:hypothetical protein
MKYLLSLVLALALSTSAWAWDTDIINDVGNIEAKYMIGVSTNGDAEGGTASIISGPFAWVSHKNMRVLELVVDTGLGTRFGSTNENETAKLTQHIGGGLCAFQVFCTSYIWVIPDQEPRFNFAVNVPALVKNLGKVVDKTTGLDTVQ